MTEEPQKPLTLDDLKQLSDLTSNAFQTSNRYWLALMAVAVIVLVPRAPTSDGNVDLPFSLGAIREDGFYSVSLAILVAVTIAFAAAHAQAFRAHKLAMSRLEHLEKESVAPPTAIHPRDLYDLLLRPTMNRVGPLALLLRGGDLFFPAAAGLSSGRRNMITLYYLILKLTASFFYFIVPSYALWAAFRDAELVGAFEWLAVTGVAIAALTLVHIMTVEVTHIATVVRARLGTERVT